MPSASDGAVRQLSSEAGTSRSRVSACDTWDAFRREVRGTIRPLFEEHLDMLEGAAFRVIGFDDGVAQDADDLLVRLDKILSVNDYLAVPCDSGGPPGRRSPRADGLPWVVVLGPAARRP